MKNGANDYVMKTNLVRLGPAVRRELQDFQVRHERRLAESAGDAALVARCDALREDLDGAAAPR